MKSHRIDQKTGFYVISDVRAIDGDAIEATIQLPFGALVRKRIRLKGWWAPELEGATRAEGLFCKEALQKFCGTNWLFIHCPSQRTDKFGRILAVLWTKDGPVEPEKVLGIWQLTEAQHKAQLDASRVKTQSIGGMMQEDAQSTSKGNVDANPTQSDWGNITP